MSAPTKAERIKERFRQDLGEVPEAFLEIDRRTAE